MGVQKSELCGLTGNNHVILQTPRYPHRGVGSVSEVSWALPAQGEAGVSVRRRKVQALLASLFLLALKLPIKL